MGKPILRTYSAFETEASITPPPPEAAEPAAAEAIKPATEVERPPTDRYPPNDTASEIASALSGPLPPLPRAAALPVPLKRMASTLYETRQVAREFILNNSPILYHTESWLETLLTPTEYIPPSILLFVVIMVSIMTAIALEYPEYTDFDDRMHSTMIGFISLLIVFRTSQAYARWWEGRTLWGAIVNSTRNLASNAACLMSDEARYTRAITCTIAFAYACKQNLRGRKFDLTEMQGLFEREELLLMNEVEHIPMLMIDEIRRTMKLELLSVPQSGAGRKGRVAASLVNSDMILSTDIKALVDAMGGCERIAKTPMPFGYLAQLRIFILVWLISWPFALSPEYRWATIPLVSICGFMMLKIEEMAVQIEQPFGTGNNDLPLDTICVTIERNLLEILRRAEYLRLGERAEADRADSDEGLDIAGSRSQELLVARLVPPRPRPAGPRPPPGKTPATPFPTPAPTAQKIMAVFSTENLVASSSALLADANAHMPFAVKRRSTALMPNSEEPQPPAPPPS